MAKVEIKVDASGFGKLVVDDKEVPAVEGIDIQIEGGKRPKVFFKIYGNPVEVDFSDAEVVEIEREREP